MKNKKKIKLYDLLTVIIFLTVIFAISVTFIFKEDVSETAEEQNLQMMPELTWTSLKDGIFAEKIDKYFNDQFPYRSKFLNLKAVSETILQKGENNGVLIGKDGQQANKNFSVYGSDNNGQDAEDIFDNKQLETHVKAQLDAIKSKTELAKESNITLTTLIPPRTLDVTSSAFSYPNDVWSSFNDILRSYSDGSDIIYMLDEFKELYDKGEYVYYRTDHHWTSLGAYYCYLRIMDAYGMADEALSLNDFEIETVSDSFYGAFYRVSGYKLSKPDQIDFYKRNNDEYVTQICKYPSDDVEYEIEGMFDYEKLKSNDQYTSFISGKNSYVKIIRKDGEGREKLILKKDSFAQALAPFLAQHFDLYIYDFTVSDIRLNLVDKATQIGCDKILIVCNAQNIIEQNYLKIFK